MWVSECEGEGVSLGDARLLAFCSSLTYWTDVGDGEDRKSVDKLHKAHTDHELSQLTFCMYHV